MFLLRFEIACSPNMYRGCSLCLQLCNLNESHFNQWWSGNCFRSEEPVGTFQGSCVTFSMFPMNIKSPGAPGRNLLVRAMSRDNIWPDSTTSLWDDCWGDHNKPEYIKPEHNKPHNIVLCPHKTNPIIVIDKVFIQKNKYDIL